jgi:DNA polymerase sigma
MMDWEIPSSNNAVKELAKVLLADKVNCVNNLTKITGPRVKVPLIKFESEFVTVLDKDFSLLKNVKSTQVEVSKKVDISFSSRKHSGIKVADGVLAYEEAFPALRPLALLMKKLKYAWNLPTPHEGGLSSYCSVMMIVSFLQIHDITDKPKNIGSLFAKFLHYFGYSFDFRHGLCPTGPFEDQTKSSKVVFQLPPNASPFVVQDPFDRMNNIGCTINIIHNEQLVKFA